MGTPRDNDNDSKFGGKGGGPPNPVYHGENPNLEAHCIYFYLLSPGTEIPKLYFEDLQRPVLRSEMPDRIVDIMRKIRAGLLQQEPVPTEWTRKSFFAAVLDIAGSTLTPGNAVVFELQGAGGGGNHTFRDGEDIPALPAPFQDRGAFFCFNHMKHKHGHVLKYGEREPFKAHFNHPHPSPNPTVLGHEESGTNIGPPIPPPA
ncbi:MAG TPA: hypothetical protein VEW25_08800 [Allosphingosinicella sp.]|nr:hypothetical protein [Allosphingosinicella sp.]